VTDSPWGGGKVYYFFTATIWYDDFQPDQLEWMFALADMNDNGLFDGGTDKFSPKTTSSSTAPIPEPATMLLFGTGLIGMAGIGRKKFKK
jgi:hypothetical protein